MATCKIMVATIIYGSVDPEPYRSHLQFWYRCGVEMPDVEFLFHSPARLPIDTARNQAALAAMQNECEWLFFYDSDMVLDPLIIKKLLAHEKPMVMGHCVIRGAPFESMTFRFDKDDPTRMDRYEATEEEIAEGNGLVKMDAVGTACTLINVGIFKALPSPWFVTAKLHTEDVYFCVKARSLKEFECFVDYNTVCGHLLDPVVAGIGNRDALNAYYNSAKVDNDVAARPNPIEEVGACI